MMKGWSDGKRFLVEDIVLYTVALLSNLLYDFFRNLLFAVNLVNESHPYVFGTGQTVLLVLLLVQLARKINELRYY